MSTKYGDTWVATGDLIQRINAKLGAKTAGLSSTLIRSDFQDVMNGQLCFLG